MKGVTQLGYLAFDVSDLDAWERFGTEVLGMTVGKRFADGFTLRLDSHASRLFVRKAAEGGPVDDLAVLGLQVDDAAALAEVTARLRAAGRDVTEATADELALRGVAGMVKYVDPGGVPSEVFWGPELAKEPFASRVVPNGFVAEAQGLGHLVINAASQAESKAFYEDVLGFRLSDRIVANVHGYAVDIAFFHAEGATSRHHTVAFGERQKKRLHHFMVEVRTFDDVGLGFDRTLRAGLRIMQTLGRHPNDRMFSFYARTPSGFHFEYGWGGRSVDDTTWQPTTYDHISEWGHHPPEFLVPRKESRT